MKARWIGLTCLAPVLLCAAPASAHPLGLPAFAQVVATGEKEVTVRWNAAPDDVAALAREAGLDVHGERVLTREQDAAFARSEALRQQVAAGIRVRQGVDCKGVLVPVGSVVTQGVTVRFSCPQKVRRIRLRIALLHDVDGRYRTLAATAGPAGTDRTMHTAAEPEHEVEVDLGKQLLPASAQQPDDVRGAFGGSLPFERRFVTALDTSPGAPAFALAVLVAFVVGAAHALAPGHGKAIGAAYLVGDRGRPRDAVVLGITVALMHTGSVVVLGLALWSAARQPDAARLTTGISLASGIVLTAVGGWLLARRVKEPKAHGHAHPHAVPAKPLSREGLVALGAAGGLLPSPSALLLLLTALAVGRVGAGLVLIAAFSIGLALTLTVVGLAVLKGRDLAHDRGGRLHEWAHQAPLVGAAFVLALGVTIVVRALL